jgi:hypothetical protein
MATAPRPGVGRRKEEDQVKIGVRVDGQEFVVRPSEITAKQAGALRRETGFSFQGLMRAANTDPDLDVIAAIVWLARLQRGEVSSYESVASALDYESEIGELTDAEASEAVADDPSLSGEN